MDWLLDPFSGDIMRRALLEVLIAGVACGGLGVWVLLYRQAYAAESLAHGMLPGLVLAAIAGAPLLAGAVGGVLLAAATVALAGRDERLGPDVGVSVAITALLGLGALLAALPAVPPRLGELLFGDLLGVTSGDLIAGAALAGALLAALAAAHRRLALAAFDPAAARSLGAPPARWEAVVLVLIAVATVAVVGGLGSLLLVALLLAPAAAALHLVRRLVPALALATALAWCSGVAGLLVSYHFDVAAGAAVALCALGTWAAVTLLERLVRWSRPAHVAGSGV